MAENITYIWLAVGVLFLLLEALGANGIGFFFAGLGALTVGTLINLGHVAPDAYVLQSIVFFATTALWTAVLWAPLKNHRKKSSNYNNIIGDTAYVGSGGISKKEGGEVTWSGTIMKSKLAEHAGVDALAAGTEVTITAISGATLTVKPKL
ncbi:MAG: hypothetical protein EBR02_08650 [Alphaproteobacteria bacterium]|nr:hypothetical protein [Alphaproteobacteria bacterium]